VKFPVTNVQGALVAMPRLQHFRLQGYWCRQRTSTSEARSPSLHRWAAYQQDAVPDKETTPV